MITPTRRSPAADGAPCGALAQPRHLVLVTGELASQPPLAHLAPSLPERAALFEQGDDGVDDWEALGSSGESNCDRSDTEIGPTEVK